MIEPGEYFHRETLTVVTLSRQWVSSRSVMLQGPVGRLFEETEADFLRDYARNVPVTRELLEAMGWECTPVLDGIARADLKVDDEHHMSVFFADGEIHGTSLFSDKGSELILSEPATLRDLLNTLRVFGIAADVPELSKETT